MKLQLSICSITFFLCQFAVRPSKPLTVLEFNRKTHELFAARDTAVQHYSVEGYYTGRPLPILVSDPVLLRRNSIRPDSLYILLQGKGIDSIRDSRDADSPKAGHSHYEGSFVRVQIDAKIPYRRNGPDSLLTKKNLLLNVDRRPMIIRVQNELKDNVAGPVRLLDASYQQASNGIRTTGMAREFFLKLVIRTEGKIVFDSIWVNHRCFKIYLANNRPVISNAPAEFEINDTITVRASAIGSNSNKECPSPTLYKGDALLRVLVDGKPYFITIKKFRWNNIYNRL